MCFLRSSSSTININIKVFHYQDCLTLSKQTWSPVIVIDNTNVQKFEIFPYIQLANRYRYSSRQVPRLTSEVISWEWVVGT